MVAMTIGLVCDNCDGLNPLNSTVCQTCGKSLGIVQKRASQTGLPQVQNTRRCAYCGTDAPAHFKFCGSCGKSLANAGPPAVEPPPAPKTQPVAEVKKPGGAPAKTMFFSAMQAPGRAKLILIKGDGDDGVSYMLSGTDHLAGRSEGAILFPEDPLLSPRHANFVYRDGKLHVRDEGSANGVFLRILKPVTLEPGSLFLVGEQLLRVEAVPAELQPVPEADGTYFYGSPKRPSKLQLVQMLAGGAEGMVHRAREDLLTIGREGNDVNFPDDPFISGRHASVRFVETREGGRFQLADLGSKNGTFVRVQEESPLYHGDYVFIGQQLLRVEIT